MKEMPQCVRNRLARYYRVLRAYWEKGVLRVNSKQLASEMKYEELVDASTVRRDLAHLGTFGRQGYGYDVSLLIEIIATEIGIGQQEEMILIGAGHMGTALLKYNNFTNKIGRIVCAFDLAPKVDSIDGVPIHHISQLRYLYKEKYRIAILAIPSQAAQLVAETLAKLGVRVIINYSDGHINIPSAKVKVQNIDLNFFIQEAIFSLRLC